LLDKSYGGVGAKTLEGRLARDPEFFCEVIRLVFRSDKDERKAEIDENKKTLAEQGYRLLREWTTPPGMLADGTWNSDAFSKWLTTVKASTKESGHYGVAMSQVGQVLPYVPADPGGLWIDKTVAEALNEKNADELRSGFTIELFNMRGTHGFTHGAEERKIAAGVDRGQSTNLDRIAPGVLNCRHSEKNKNRTSERFYHVIARGLRSTRLD
jgi:hypothetical protein